MNTISKSKLKAKMLQIFREIEETGEELIITDHNNPVLKIIPYKGKYSSSELFKDFQGKIVYNEDINTPTANEWDIT